MFNNSSNYAFPSPQFNYLPVSNYELLPSMNYQYLSPFTCLYMDPNYPLQSCQTSPNYTQQSFFYPQINHEQNEIPFSSEIPECSDENQKIVFHNELHFYPNQSEYINEVPKVTPKSSGAFSYYNFDQENEKLNQELVESVNITREKTGEDFNNEIFVEDKKSIQNLRYQRKNIEANIVNKIYTHLKMILKFGGKSLQNRFDDREKLNIFFKVLEKLEKAKKQIIKREFLNALVSIDESLPGYGKIVKELQRKGQSIEEFEIYIRVIIKNYLKNEAPNSILTSKKMNPFLWIDHLRKVREIEEYLFYNLEEENIN